MTSKMAILFHLFLAVVDTCVMFKSSPLYTDIWVVTDLTFKYRVYSNMYTLKTWQEHFDVHKKHNSQLRQKPHPPRYVNVSKHLFIVIVHMLRQIRCYIGIHIHTKMKHLGRMILATILAKFFGASWYWLFRYCWDSQMQIFLKCPCNSLFSIR